MVKLCSVMLNLEEMRILWQFKPWPTVWLSDSDPPSGLRPESCHPNVCLRSETERWRWKPRSCFGWKKLEKDKAFLFAKRYLEPRISGSLCHVTRRLHTSSPLIFVDPSHILKMFEEWFKCSLRTFNNSSVTDYQRAFIQYIYSSTYTIDTYTIQNMYSK